MMYTLYVPYCHVCTYDIIGLQEQRCPECRAPFDIEAQQQLWAYLEGRSGRWAYRMLLPGLCLIGAWGALAILAVLILMTDRITGLQTLGGCAIIAAVAALFFQIKQSAVVSDEISLHRAMRKGQPTHPRHRMAIRIAYALGGGASSVALVGLVIILVLMTLLMLFGFPFGGWGGP